MRIIAGTRKGLKLTAPVGNDVRPTTDRVKESVFNIIQSYLPAERVLDLYAGSASLGIEALSRRSEHCVFVDCNKKSFELLRHNVEISGFTEKAELVFSDSLLYLEKASAPFDIIFLDPPYNKGYIGLSIDKIYERNLLKDGGIIVAETEKNGEVAEHFGLDIIKLATYGKTVITVLKKR